MKTLSASSLGLNESMVSAAILDVIDTLMRAGFKAYIVGGGVRDLLLGLRPKDFDAVTNATPAQIREVFGKRSRIIGRRFELAHVYSGREMIEVATFRAPPRKVSTTASGMITRDNVWGTIQQDYVRRDFTINAMYYQPREGVVLDFTHAISDIKNKQLTLQGKPTVRFEEDPVRMLRTLRFAAKLEFTIDPEITKVLTPAMTQLLLEVSPHRIYDETQKMFSGGHLAPLLPLMVQYHVWNRLFVDVSPELTPLIKQAAENTDARIAIGKSINPAFFYAVLLWEPFLARVKELVATGAPHSIAWTQAGLDVLRRQSKHTAIPRFSEMFIREVWELQPRLEQPKPRQVPALAAHPRFRAGFDFLLMREQTGDVLVGTMGQWWHDYQTLSNDGRERAIADLNRLQQRLQRKRQAGETVQPLQAVIAEADHSVSTVEITAQNTVDNATLNITTPTTKAKRVRNRKPKTATHEQTLAALAAEVQEAAIFDESTPLKSAPTREKPLESVEAIQLLPSDDPAMIHANLRAKRRSNRNDSQGSSNGSDTRYSLAPRRRQPRSKPIQIEPTIAPSTSAEDAS
ncbi:polynucleotide adenylyltransferase PcnB [Aquirhabdus parva]|uniref:Poly(A) polymerase I n=1 Tax=Aquirhabdus parva TaxID=2283318 RepID=A0A345PBL6_9GAMM|nr:polynucleotide adenylyltransferase PcnB [Aquirhabdus parva]AXI04675.1 polynucleotide adenylyltransferase PcnB [Aquirhabdus parva]